MDKIICNLLHADVKNGFFIFKMKDHLLRLKTSCPLFNDYGEWRIYFRLFDLEKIEDDFEVEVELGKLEISEACYKYFVEDADYSDDNDFLSFLVDRSDKNWKFAIVPTKRCGFNYLLLDGKEDISEYLKIYEKELLEISKEILTLHINV